MATGRSLYAAAPHLARAVADDPWAVTTQVVKHAVCRGDGCSLRDLGRNEVKIGVAVASGRGPALAAAAVDDLARVGIHLGRWIRALGRRGGATDDVVRDAVVLWNLHPATLIPGQSLGETSKSKAAAIARSLDASKVTWAELGPIDVATDGRVFVIQDGHHRALAAAIRGELVPARVVLVDGPLDGERSWSIFRVAERMRSYRRRP